MVILLNCSYRGEKSNTRYFLGQLEKLLKEPCRQVDLNRIKDKKELAGLMRDADAVVLGMPLYVDGAPAQAVELMEWLYTKEKDSLGKLPVYVVANMGFYESSQLDILLSIVKNWCAKMGLVYGGGLAVGAGEMMGRMYLIAVGMTWGRQAKGYGVKRKELKRRR